MVLKEGTIRHFQEYIAEKIKQRGFENEELHERLILLTEELGELVKSCRKFNGMNIDQAIEVKENTGEEIADMINLIFAVGIKLGIDIETEFLEKEQILDLRTYKRSSKP